MKITKEQHAFKGYGSTYNVEILNSFNPELQLKDTESAVKKIERKGKTKHGNFYSRSKAEIIISENVFK